MSKPLTFTLTSFMIVSLAAVLSFFMTERMKPVQPESHPDVLGQNATMSITDFQQTNTKNGIREWRLNAASAHLIESEHKAVFKNLSVVFFMKDNSQLNVTADQGVLQTDTNNLEAFGNVIIQNSQYQLKTETLHYQHDDRIIRSHVPVEIFGQSMRFSGDSMIYSVNENIARLEKNVKGKIHGTLGF